MEIIEKKIPQNIQPPPLLQFKKTNHTKDVTNLVDKVFKNHYGETKYFNSIQGWRIDALENDSSIEIPPMPTPTSFEPAEGDANEVDDDLPF